MNFMVYSKDIGKQMKGFPMTLMVSDLSGIAFHIFYIWYPSMLYLPYIYIIMLMILPQVFATESIYSFLRVMLLGTVQVLQLLLYSYVKL